jgi:tetratricopeptide (TPR) repeat protein
VRVREKLGEVLYRAGRYDAAIQVLEPAAETFRAAGNWESLGRVTAWMGRAHSLRGTPHEGVALITALLERLDRSGASPPSLGALYEALGWLLFTAGQYGAALPASAQAAELARASGDDRTRVLADWNRVNILQLLGRLGEALRVGQEVLPLAEAVGDLECLVRAYLDLAYIHTLRGAIASGRSYIERALALATQMGDPGQHAFTLAFRGWFAGLSGTWGGARTDLDQAVALSRQVDRSLYSAYPLALLARLSLAEGTWAAAKASVQEALALAEWSGELQALRWASTVMAELDVLEGRPEAARARLIPLLDRPGLEECDVTALLPALAWAYLELGQVDRATDAVGQALLRARREDMRLVLVQALRVQALIALRHGQRDEAARSLEEGIALARSMPHPYAEARLLYVYGRLHVQKGEPDAAQERFEAALAIFARLGARTDGGQVEQALGQLSQKQGLIETRLTDAQWAQIEALLPPRPRRRGRPRADDRRTLEAILYVRRTSCAWADLPAELGDEATAHRRWQEWQATGLWERITAIVQVSP